MYEEKHTHTQVHTHADTLVVPRDSEEPPGLSHASCFHCMAQKQRRGGDKQASEQKKRKERRAGEPENGREEEKI